jgi:hypothetical protein
LLENEFGVENNQVIKQKRVLREGLDEIFFVLNAFLDKIGQKF